MKKILFLFLISIILSIFSHIVFSSETIHVKDYIQDKLPSIFQFYLSSLEELNQDEKEFIDLLVKLPKKEQENYAKKLYNDGFSLELLNNIKELEKVKKSSSTETDKTSLELKTTWSSKNIKDLAIGMHFTNVREIGNKIKADVLLYNNTLTWVYVEQDFTYRKLGGVPVSTQEVCLLGPLYTKNLGTIEFSKDSFLHFNGKTAIGVSPGTQESNMLLGALAIDLMMRGFFSKEVPPDAFDRELSIQSQAEIGISILDQLFYTIESNCSGPLGVLGRAIAMKDIDSTINAFGKFLSCIMKDENKKIMQELLTKIFSAETANRFAEKISKSIGELLNLPMKTVLIRILTENTFNAPPESWVRIEAKEIKEKNHIEQSDRTEELLNFQSGSKPNGRYPIDWSVARSNGWKNPLGESARLITSQNYDFASQVYLNNWGYQHAGVDIVAKSGLSIKSIAEGEVVNVWHDSDPMQIRVIIRHEAYSDVTKKKQTFYAVYGHVDAIIQEGESVTAGQHLGVIRKAGDPSHLHFGINIEHNPSGHKQWFTTPHPDINPRDDGWVDPIVFLEENKPYENEKKLAVALIMDRSGSMSGEKLVKEMNAADAFIAGLHNDEYSCLVTFSASARTEVELLQVTPANKTKFHTTIETVGAGGKTNIGAGLSHGLQQLDRASESTPRAALLMSDGKHNTGELWPVVEEYELRGWPIHTVAYGSDADQENLENIAMRTGGTFFPADIFTISQIYQRISAHTHNQSVLFAYNDMISQGEKLDYQIPIDPDITSTTFFVDWQGSVVDLHLQTPEEKKINPDNYKNFPEVDYQTGDTFCFYQVDEPKSGDWQATLYGKEIDRESEQVNLTVSGSSPLLVNIFGLQPSYRRGEAIQIQVKVLGLFGSEPEILRDVKVTAKIKKPSPNLKKMLQKRVIDLGKLFQYALTGKKTISLHDDGRHGDWKADDGIFGAIYKDTDENGHYVITITCEAQKPDGEKITRTLQESVQVGPIEDRTVTLADFLGL